MPDACDQEEGGDECSGFVLQVCCKQEPHSSITYFAADQADEDPSRTGGVDLTRIARYLVGFPSHPAATTPVGRSGTFNPKP